MSDHTLHEWRERVTTICRAVKIPDDYITQIIQIVFQELSQRDIEARAKSNLRATEIISRLILNCSNPSVIKWLEKAQKEILADEALLDNRKN